MASLLGMAGIETIEGESDADTTTRLIGISTDGFLEIERVLSALPGRFLGGESPAQPDAFMATMLVWCHNALACGLSIMPQAPCTLAHVGAGHGRHCPPSHPTHFEPSFLEVNGRL